MRLIMITAALTVAVAASAFAQGTSPSAATNGVPQTTMPPVAVGNGTAKALEGTNAPYHAGDRTDAERDRPDKDKAVVNESAATEPGSMPRDGTHKPAGTTGAPPYGASAAYGSATDNETARNGGG